jgi:acetyltransferase-like isoleucine patch superfamily enzyme
MKVRTSGRDSFKKYKFILVFLYLSFRIFPRFFRIYLLDLFRNSRGRKGFVLRYVLLKSVAKKCGDNVVIYTNVIIINPEKITLGSNVSIHPFSYIDASGEIEIGNNVSIAHGSSLISSTHTYSSHDIPIKYQEIVKKPIHIEDNVWIGAKVTILYGVTIGSGSIIGANSLVNKSIDMNLVVGGVPARTIKTR